MNLTDWAVPSAIAFGVSAVVALHVWIGAMRWLRNRLGKYDEHQEHSNYHNGAIYRDFSFFYKTTLAVIAGVVFLACGGECSGIDGSKAAALVKLAGYLEFLSGLLFSFCIFAHQKSKIEHWKSEERYSYAQILLWQETWMAVAIVAISATFAFAVAPYLASTI